MMRFVTGSFLVLVLLALPGAVRAAQVCDNDHPCGCGEACVAGTCEFIACQGKTCGSDGCGSVCGECAVGEYCAFDQCSATLPRGCETSATGGCSIKEFNCLTVTGGCSPACAVGTKCTAGGCVADEYGCAPLCDPDTQVCRQNVTAACGCEACVVDQDPNCLDAWDFVCVEACIACGTTCTACEPSCDGKVCGSDGCGGSCGTCDAGTCEGGQCVMCSCQGKSCGDDGCGNSCGDCEAGFLCDQGDCVEDPCQGLTYEGCCAGNTVRWCQGAEILSLSCDDEPVCGWDGYGYYCGTDGGADPDDLFPIACPNCTTSCDGKQCGDDGCGGVCGLCGMDEACEDGLCVACTPQCTGKECGDNGCGGSCGACAGDTYCVEGACVNDPCMGITDVGCCAGTVMKFCSFGELVTEDCTEAPLCGWVAGPEFYACDTDGSADPSGTYVKACPGSVVCSCDGKVCGDDGCGVSCGDCAQGEKCDAGACVPDVCVAQCTGKECGDDGCGGSCGDCAAGETCDAGACVPCQAECNDKECGDDGCGGSCGDCAANEDCLDFVCELKPCVPECTDKQCGSNGCDGVCGTCAAGSTCNAAGKCIGDEPDTVDDTTPDVPADTATGDTVADEDKGGGGGGCSVDSGARFGSFWLLALALAFIPMWRRRVA